MKAIDGFAVAIGRAEHVLKIYDLVCDTRQRSARSTWSVKFKDFMGWPKNEEIVRVDGKDRDSILIMRENVGISRKQFAHDYLSELLRATLVVAVSSLDRYMHDIVVERSWNILSWREEDIPKELKGIRIPVLQTKRALGRLKNNSNSRPGHIVKQAIQEVLHREYTFQKPDDILKAAKMLGVKDFWGEISKVMHGNHTSKEVINRLKSIVERRNQIVHEADIVLNTRRERINLREIERRETDENVQWIKDFVYAIDEILNS